MICHLKRRQTEKKSEEEEEEHNMSSLVKSESPSGETESPRIKSRSPRESPQKIPSTSSLLSRISPNSSVMDEVSLHLADSYCQVVGTNEGEGEEEAAAAAAEEDGRRQMLQSECLTGRSSDEASIGSSDSASDEISLHLAESAYQMACINEGEEDETERQQLQKSRHQMLTSKEGASFVSDRGSSNFSSDENSLHLAASSDPVPSCKGDEEKPLEHNSYGGCR